MAETKQQDAIRKLAKAGWTVDDDGSVKKPCGEVRQTFVKKPPGNRTAYRCFNVKHGKISRPVLVHKLAAFLLFGEESFVLQVRHLDGDSMNNRRSNLALGTGSQNMLDRKVEDRVTHARKAAAKLRKLTDDDVLKIRASVESGYVLAERYGVARSTITYVRNRSLYTDV